MRIIPVIDLLGGQVVHAHQGRRDDYRPLHTPLCPSSQPLAVADALLQATGSHELYIADLDAILGRGNHDAVLAALRQRFPAVTLLVDRGFADHAVLQAWIARGLGRPVLGSESAPDAGWMSDALTVSAAAAPLLSLDFRETGFVGPRPILDDPAHWPQAVIAMALPQVGSSRGPDIALVRQLKEQGGPQRHVLAAGGVRNAADLERLAAAGASGVLVASAVHDGRLSAADLAVWGS